MQIIEKALKDGRKTLSEHESKQLLSLHNIPVTREILVEDRKDLDNAVNEIGFPLVMKGSSSVITHKTEKGLIRVDIRDQKEAGTTFEEIMGKMAGKEKGSWSRRW